jgi:hypothetical protein
MAKNELVKTLTFGLGNMYGFDKRKVELFALNDDGRKKTYDNLRQCFRDFAKLCNYTTSLYYAHRILKVDLKEMGYSTSYTQIINKMDLDTPLASRVLNQAHNLAKNHFTGEHGKSLMGKGDRVLSTIDPMERILYIFTQTHLNCGRSMKSFIFATISSPTNGQKPMIYLPGWHLK